MVICDLNTAEPKRDVGSTAQSTLSRASDEEQAIQARAKEARPDPSKSGVELLEADSPTIGLWIVVVFAVLIAGSLGQASSCPSHGAASQRRQACNRPVPVRSA